MVPSVWRSCFQPRANEVSTLETWPPTAVAASPVVGDPATRTRLAVLRRWWDPGVSGVRWGGSGETGPPQFFLVQAFGDNFFCARGIILIDPSWANVQFRGSIHCHRKVCYAEAEEVRPRLVSRLADACVGWQFLTPVDIT